jgi:hypothetical protein
MAQYTLQQQVFALSLISNAAAPDSGTAPVVEAELKQAITKFLTSTTAQSYIGSWSVAWGPVISEQGGASVADNAMFVARGTDADGNPVYVVAVAGTNVHSSYDELFEDWSITLQPWPYPLPADTASPKITQGTIDGVGALLAMQDPATNETLQAFLAGVQSGSGTLVFTGHSLGGALSPALALALFGAPGSGTLDPASWGAVYLFPTAGPTVGDQGYTNFWNSVFPAAQDASGEKWNQLTWNTLDVVPRAWALLEQLDTLYPASAITWTRCLAKIQTALLTKVANAGGTFDQPANVPLTGTFAPWAGAGADSPMVTYFLTEMLHQHVWAYFDLLNVPELRQFFPAISDPTSSSTASPTVQKLCTEIVLFYCLLEYRGQCGSSSAAGADEGPVHESAAGAAP